MSGSWMNCSFEPVLLSGLDEQVHQIGLNQFVAETVCDSNQHRSKSYSIRTHFWMCPTVTPTQANIPAYIANSFSAPVTPTVL